MAESGSVSPALESDLQEQVLSYLQARVEPPSPEALTQLVDRYTRRVPWESAFRIAKQAASTAIEACPRWPEEFWLDAINRGGGGTCFESNYAFNALLLSLGYETYLTVNDMSENRGCHTAIVVRFDNDRWLVDVGIPLYIPIPLDPTRITTARCAYHDYTSTPLSGLRFEVRRSRHPSPYIFTLIDRPVTDAVYRRATTADYGRGGLFLDAIIITRIIGSEIWRYNGRADPPLLESFGENPSSQVMERNSTDILAELFEMDRAVLRAAAAASGTL